MSSANAPSTPMRASLRESRMVLERLMQVVRIDEGLVPSLRDCALYSAALGLGGFLAVSAQLELLRGAAPAAIRLVSEAPLTIDCAGQHAWVVAEAVVDLLVAEARAAASPGPEIAEARVLNVAEPGELGIVAAIARKHGFTTELSHGEGEAGIRIVLRPASADEPDPLQRIRLEGLPVAQDLWWRLFHRANEALAADTVESRRHAGPIRVEEDGRIVGRQDDDETDFSLLVGPAVSPHTPSATPIAKQGA
ncbi:MAG: hypothetical protein KF735_03745 [Chelatococcus sp.]|uniref:hypothetical protein n=1 Tax=Chelatococcus sp. TaxID=1953771 RepID=UPI0025C22BD9|nr:hypothetical protein [Chelatococcus sp.]MBX3536724.1 hypothetical protein [Chelatococcus sp.]